MILYCMQICLECVTECSTELWKQCLWRGNKFVVLQTVLLKKNKCMCSKFSNICMVCEKGIFKKTITNLLMNLSLQ